MKRIIISTILVSLSIMASAQTDSLASDVEPELAIDAAEQMPEFPGGQDSLLRYLSSIQYPQLARENDIQGKVFIQFIVEKTGEVAEMRILKGAEKLLDDAALAHVRNMPRWKTPGYQDGKPVRVRYVVPLIFKFELKPAG